MLLPSSAALSGKISIEKRSNRSSRRKNPQSEHHQTLMVGVESSVRLWPYGNIKRRIGSGAVQDVQFAKWSRAKQDLTNILS